MKCEKRKTILIIVVILFLSFCLYELSGKDAVDLKERSFERNAPGKGLSKETLEAFVGEISIGEVDITIPEMKYSYEECEKQSLECEEKIREKIMGSNTDGILLDSDIDYVTRINGYPFSLYYETDTPEKIDVDGLIISTEEFDTQIKVTMEYEDFRKDIYVDLHIVPGFVIKSRTWRNLLLEMIDNSESSKDDKLMLPDSIQGQEIVYQLPGRNKEPFFLVLGVVASIGYVLAKKNDERKRKSVRKEQILLEYPILLQKMALYLASGMTIRNIWVEIYEEGMAKKGKDNPLYFEMGISANELQSGISEGMVYKRFGERTGVSELVRFTALLSQNLKKGSSKLKELLLKETEKAFELRKQRAVREGEKAGTKLLFPMMLLLLDVLIIIMVPAFWSI